MGRPRVVAVVGATATGKTELAERVAAALDGEVVCADSRQLFRELELGTGKPTPAERALRPHHMFEVLALGQRCSAGEYGRACRQVLAGVFERGRVPVLVGGSGLYLHAAHYGLAEEPPRDPEVRARLEVELATEGAEAMHERLAKLDPPTAARLAQNDIQRMLRALEVVDASGVRLSWWQEHTTPREVREDWRVIEVVVTPAELRARIAVRTHAMFTGGLVEETRALVARGLEPALRALRAIGYDEALDLLAGRLTATEAEARTTLRTAQLAKRQRTWFRHQVEAIRLSADDPLALAQAAIGAARG